MRVSSSTLFTAAMRAPPRYRRRGHYGRYARRVFAVPLPVWTFALARAAASKQALRVFRPAAGRPWFELARSRASASFFIAPASRAHVRLWRYFPSAVGCPTSPPSLPCPPRPLPHIHTHTHTHCAAHVKAEANPGAAAAAAGEDAMQEDAPAPAPAAGGETRPRSNGADAMGAGGLGGGLGGQTRVCGGWGGGGLGG
jgi:hypothetical protein